MSSPPVPAKRPILALAIAGAILAALSIIIVATLGDPGVVTAEWDAADLEAVDETDADPDALRLERGEEVDVGMERDPMLEAAADTGNLLMVRGRVVDLDGRPVADAEVALELRRGFRGTERVRKPTRSAADGRFAFRGPSRRARSVSILVTHPDFAPTIADHRVPSGPTDVEEVDIGDVELLRGATLTGSVTSAASAALSDARVQLQPQRGNRLTWSPHRELLLPELATDLGGRFRYDRLMPGIYRIEARAPGHLVVELDAITIHDGELVELPPIVLGNAVQLTVTVRDRRGRFVEGAQARLRASDNQYERRATTGADGLLEFDHLAPRAHTLGIQAGGFVTFRRAPVDPGATSTIDVTLEDGLRITGVVRDAATGAPVTEFAVRARRIAGLPNPQADDSEPGLRESGPPVEAKAGIPEHPQSEWSRLLRNRPQHAGTPSHHADGRFECHDLDEGIWVVDVESQNHQGTRSERLELRVGQPLPPLHLDLLAGHSISGRLTSAATGAGVARARVDLRLLPPNAERDNPHAGSNRGVPGGSATTDGEGRFTFAHVSAGRYAVAAHAAGFEQTTSPAFDVAGDVSGISLALGALASLHGRVLGAPTDGSRDLKVMAFASFRVIAARDVAADGTYRIDSLQPGAYWVRAFAGEPGHLIRQLARGQAEGGGGAGPDVTLAPGADVELDLSVELAPLGGLTGTVSRNGRPGIGLRVGVSAIEEHGAIRSAMVGPRGEYSLLQLEAGEYMLVVQSVRRASVELLRERVTIVGDTDTRHDLDLQTASIAGIVENPDGSVAESSVAESLRGTLRLIGGTTQMPAQLEVWAQHHPVHVIRVRGGRFDTREVLSGSFVAELRIHGRQPTTMPLSLRMGENRQLRLRAGVPAPPGSDGTPELPR